jgi:hypothetical protein
VCTLDNRNDESSQKDRHIRLDMIRLDMEQHLLKSIAGTVQQICLDYYWFASAYWDEKGVGEAFFASSIPLLWKLLDSNGSILLGLLVQIFTRLAVNKEKLESQFLIHLVLRTDVNKIDLVRGSHTIPDDLYTSESLGDKHPRPEEEFKLSYNSIKQSIGSSYNVRPATVIEYLKELVGESQGPEEYAFIQLQRRD